MNFRNFMRTTSPWVAPLLATALVYIFYTGIYCSDDTRYLVGIQKIAQGHPIDLTSIAERRLIFLLPGALLYSIFGTFDAAIIPYAGFYVGLTALAWAATRRYGSTTALTCATLCALTPILYFYAGTLSPDLLSALLSALLLYLLAEWRSRLDSASRGLFWIAGIMGWVAMCGVAVKESNEVVAILPLAYFCLLLLRDIKSAVLWRSAAAHLGGAIIFISMEMLLFKKFSGHWHSGLQNKAEDHGFAKFIETQGLYPFERLHYLVNMLDGWTLLLFSLALIAIIYLTVLTVLKKKGAPPPEWVIYVAFFIWPILYFTIGTSSFHEYMPPVMQARYYAPCIMPAAVLVALMLHSVSSPSKRASHCIAILAVCCMATSLYARYPDRGTSYWARSKDSHLMAIADAHRMQPDWPVLDGGNPVRDGVGLCIRLMLGEPTFEGAKAVSPTSNRPPFFVTAFGENDKRARPTSLYKLIQENVERGRWKLEFVGYYYADKKAGTKRWWQPRQKAVMEEFRSGKQGLKAENLPAGHIPWAKREMHADLYQVTVANKETRK